MQTVKLNPFAPSYGFAAFSADVLDHGALFACTYAHSINVRPAVITGWLRRLTIKSGQPLPAVASAVSFPTVGKEG
jgi:hypothetical protein